MHAAPCGTMYTSLSIWSHHTRYLEEHEENWMWQIEIDEEFSFEDLLGERRTLEEKALGEKVHGW
jgi:hypothetical protein